MRQSNTGHPLIYQQYDNRAGHIYRVVIHRREEVIQRNFSYGRRRTQETALQLALAWRDEQVRLNPILDGGGKPRNRGLPIGVNFGVTHYDKNTGLPVGYTFRVNCRSRGKQVQKSFRVAMAGGIKLSHYRTVRREVLKFYQMARSAETEGYHLDLDQIAAWVRGAIRESHTNPQRYAKKSITDEMVARNAAMIVKAENLLRTTNIPAKEIAMDVGYARYTSFMVWWRKKHPGVSPLSYRREHQKT